MQKLMELLADSSLHSSAAVNQAASPTEGKSPSLMVTDLGGTS